MKENFRKRNKKGNHSEFDQRRKKIVRFGGGSGVISFPNNCHIPLGSRGNPYELFIRGRKFWEEKIRR